MVNFNENATATSQVAAARLPWQGTFAGSGERRASKFSGLHVVQQSAQKQRLRGLVLQVVEGRRLK
jgi:hypothetical protein